MAGSDSSPDSRLMAAIEAFWIGQGEERHGAADSGHGLHGLRFPARRCRDHGLRLRPVVHTPADVYAAGPHNADERIHVDDLLLSVQFHLDLARRLFSPP